MRDAIMFGRLLLILAAFMVVGSLLGVLFSDAQSTKLLLQLLVVTGGLAVAYIARVWWRNEPGRGPDHEAGAPEVRGRSVVVGLLLFICSVIWVVAAVLAWLTNRRLDGLPPLPQGAAITAEGILAMIFLIHLTAVFIWLRRRPGRGE